jgi:5-methyltetrahydropteroyltriglutamate--homocysteine methyltransferase
MASRNLPPFRADHVGSLRRPESLMKARERLLGPHDLDHNFGPHGNADLHKLEDEAIREVVRLQQNAGLPITDGEFRRIWWAVLLSPRRAGTYRGEEKFATEATPCRRRASTSPAASAGLRASTSRPSAFSDP